MQVFRTLTAKMEAIAGARVEHNKYCLSVHFRCVREEVYICIDQLYYSVPRPVDFFLVVIHTHVGFTFTSAGMECRERGGQVGAQGVPEPQAHSRQKGEEASYVSITSDDMDRNNISIMLSSCCILVPRLPIDRSEYHWATSSTSSLLYSLHSFLFMVF